MLNPHEFSVYCHVRQPLFMWQRGIGWSKHRRMVFFTKASLSIFTGGVENIREVMLNDSVQISDKSSSNVRLLCKCGYQLFVTRLTGQPDLEVDMQRATALALQCAVVSERSPEEAFPASVPVARDQQVEQQVCYAFEVACGGNGIGCDDTTPLLQIR